MKSCLRVRPLTVPIFSPLFFVVFAASDLPFNPAAADYGSVEQIATERFAIEVDEEILYAPYLSSKPVVATETHVKRLICLQHGAARNPFRYLEGMVSAITTAGVERETVAVAFQWLEEKDINAHRDNTSLAVDRLLYFSSDWRAGDKSLSTIENPRPFRISNFQVIDRFLLDSVARYPNLREIVVTGHSAGGQVVSRYAIATRLEQSLPKEADLSLRFVIFNPSSYLYLDNKRWNEASGQFEVPTVEQIREVPKFDHFKYGLVDANEYFRCANSDGEFASFPARKVAYVIGEDDCDPNHKDLDKAPEAMMQGSNRLSRGLIYFRYLSDRFGADILQHQRLVILPGVGHDSGQCFASPSGMNLLFGVGVRDDGPIAKYSIANGK